MAYHGGPTSLPRAHRPRAPIMSAPAPLTAPLAPLRHNSSSNNNNNNTQQQQQVQLPILVPPPQVSLAAPRPDNERATNEYVETPFRVHQVFVPQPPPTSSPPPALPRVRPTRLAIPPPPIPVTKQPGAAGGGAGAASFSKEQLPAECVSRQNIICPECGNCRCPSCQQPRPLPERWLCDNKCLCSADAIIDYASCLCCVKGLFYHCSESDGGASCADNPCGCGPDKRTARWGCLAALSCVLPCLWFYWPLQCGKRAVETCYARHSRQGCRCRPTQTHLTTPEKRLLDSSPDF